MSWWRALRNDPISTRQASPADRTEVSALLSGSWRHFGSHTPDDQAAALQSGLSTLAFARNEAVGFLGLTARAPDGSPPGAWADVSLVGISGAGSVEDILSQLLRQALPALQDATCKGLVCLTALDWLKEGLARAGFTEIDQVISYVHSDPRRAPLPIEVAQLRPVDTRDADTILALNAAAFASLWRYDDATIIGWLMTAGRAVVAHLREKPVGFALTADGTAGNYAHLIRVVTHPKAQGRGVGRQLVVDALQHAYTTGAPGLALNTQVSNTVSRHLYESLGFRPVDPLLSVLASRL